MRLGPFRREEARPWKGREDKGQAFDKTLLLRKSSLAPKVDRHANTQTNTNTNTDTQREQQAKRKSNSHHKQTSIKGKVSKLEDKSSTWPTNISTRPESQHRHQMDDEANSGGQDRTEQVGRKGSEVRSMRHSRRRNKSRQEEGTGIEGRRWQQHMITSSVRQTQNRKASRRKGRREKGRGGVEIKRSANGGEKQREDIIKLTNEGIGAQSIAEEANNSLK